ncbi:hypothetical protein D3C74_285080 [compost metagenome]
MAPAQRHRRIQQLGVLLAELVPEPLDHVLRNDHVRVVVFVDRTVRPPRSGGIKRLPLDAGVAGYAKRRVAGRPPTMGKRGRQQRRDRLVDVNWAVRRQHRIADDAHPDPVVLHSIHRRIVMLAFVHAHIDKIQLNVIVAPADVIVDVPLHDLLCHRMAEVQRIGVQIGFD